MSEREKNRRAEQARQDAYSVQEFCDAHRISRAMFYKMQGGGIGPRTMKVGTRTLISEEAAAEWRREREAETAANAARQRHSAEAALQA
jgi:hypothetical protein